MTETTTAAPTPPVGPIAVPKRSNTIGLIAIILAGVGFLIAVIPPTAFLAWILLLPAFILSIIGLTRKGKAKGTSIAALIVSVIGWIVSIIVTIAAVGAAITTPGAVTVDKPGSSASAAAQPVVGDTVTNKDGVAFTVTSVECGLKTAPGLFDQTETPTGDFCGINFTVKNGSDKSIDLSNSSVTGYIGKVEYKMESTIGHLGKDSIFTSINPGLSIDSTLYTDVPVGATLNTVKLSTAWGFGSGDVTVAVK